MSNLGGVESYLLETPLRKRDPVALRVPMVLIVWRD